MLLTTAYFPPVEYFALLAKSPRAVLESDENYTKQTWRNRCRILTATGVETLQVPVIHDAPKMPIREVRIEYATPWVVRSKRAIDSAYWNSAYFEYYRDELYAILDSREEKLFDLNLRLIRFFLDKIHLPVEIALSEQFVPEDSVPDDWRFRLHPKKPNSILADSGLLKPYYQVFSDKYGFVPGLSIMDLLFNEGPDSILWLKQM